MLMHLSGFCVDIENIGQLDDHLDHEFMDDNCSETFGPKLEVKFPFVLFSSFTV